MLNDYIAEDAMESDAAPAAESAKPGKSDSALKPRASGGKRTRVNARGGGSVCTSMCVRAVCAM